MMHVSQHKIQKMLSYNYHTKIINIIHASHKLGNS